MAASTAVATTTLVGKADRRSPPAASQSKRDRKRLAVMERLAVLNEAFQPEKDATYRDQLQKIQFELNSLQNFDPYATNAIEKAVELRKEHRQALGPPVHSEVARSVLDMAGVDFPKFMSDVQDLLETRDFQLTQSKNEYNRKIREIRNTHDFKVETAKREHNALNETMHDRLVNQLNSKKTRLVKEKDSFEVNDINALLLNPAQFSLTNPGSPGGHAGKRSTRNRKETAATAEENHAHSDNKKRKRNGGEDDGSPAPTRRALDPNTTTAYWQSEKARNEARKSGAIYNIHSLFTDKELSMQYNVSALAAHRFIMRHRANGKSCSPGDSDAGVGYTNGNGNSEADGHASAPAMEMQVSHATRSTRGAGATNQNFLDDKILGVEAIANFELPSNLDLIHNMKEFNPKLPQALPFQYIKNPVRGIEQSAPGALGEADVTADLQVMAALKHYDKGRTPGSHLDNPNGLRRLLEAVVNAPGSASGSYVGFVRAPCEDVESFRESLDRTATTTSSLRNQTLLANSSLGGEPMSRQSSAKAAAAASPGSANGGRAKARKG